MYRCTDVQMYRCTDDAFLRQDKGAVLCILSNVYRFVLIYATYGFMT